VVSHIPRSGKSHPQLNIGTSMIPNGNNKNSQPSKSKALNKDTALKFNATNLDWLEESGGWFLLL
jgi:hypothetical protein